jgi:phosphoadenosine phosphosulfate reductase
MTQQSTQPPHAAHPTHAPAALGDDEATTPAGVPFPASTSDIRAFSESDLAALNNRFNTAHPRDILAWAAGFFGDDLLMTSSFGADSMCTLHMATQAKPDLRIVVINTGYLFPETIQFMEEMRQRFNLRILEYHTRNDPVAWLTINGEPDPRHRHNVDACCAANKVAVMDRAMQELAPAAWVRGVRADQSSERQKLQILQWHHRHNCWAISPILRWSSRDVFYYMKEHNLPHHPLWHQGYTSIGCNPLTCTRAIGADDDQRAGRWAGTDKKECGINLDMGANI